MNKAQIKALYRKHSKPVPAELFYRSVKDPTGTLRGLSDPGTLLKRSEVVKRWNLEPEDPSPKHMTFEQMGAFLGQVGALPDDDPCRLTDGDDGPVVTRLDDDGSTLRRISDGKPIGTIPYKRAPIVDPDSGRTIVMRIPAITMFRGVAR